MDTVRQNLLPGQPGNRLLWAFLGLALSAGPSLSQLQPMAGFTAARSEAQLQMEKHLQELPAPDAFRRHLEILTATPHPAGSAANARAAQYIAGVMEQAGLAVERHEYDVYLPRPAPEVSVALVTPIRLPLNNQEYILKEDPYSAHPDLGPAWNAFSASGDVTAEVVYVNYGRKEDFEQLRQLGVSLQGKIAVARYGGNYRGFKAKYAQESGAVGLVIYTDPADGGYVSGLPYPEGQFLTESTVQRGSLLVLGYTGDPLTPFAPALPLDSGRKVKRLDPAQVPFTTIPVTPLPYGSAVEILERMQGQPVPAGWQGGLPFAYRIGGGPDLTVRLRVEQPKGLTRIMDVVGTLEGAEFPDEWVILGCHYDAWSFGAEDPNGGTAMLLTLAEALGQLAREGFRPRRTVKIAHWDAEELGMIGSAEWVEEFRAELSARAVAYINADVAVSGPHFGAASSPTLKGVIIAATQAVAHPDTALSVYASWSPPKAEEPGIGTLGGGSDHLGFCAHLGIPAAALSMGGASLYHTNYDDFAFFSRFCDPHFVYGPAMARIDGVMALRLANADLLPYDLGRYPTDLQAHLKALADRAGQLGLTIDLNRLTTTLAPLAEAAAACAARRDQRLATGELTAAFLRPLNRQLIGLERAFLYLPGLQDRPWNRSLYASPDPFSGYDAWPLPGLRYQVETRDLEGLPVWESTYVQAMEDLTRRLQALTAALQ
ncbi:MAG: M20/M25/M40 family metallo-hydrolase [Candidatus Latescibacteria bacterium]|nr:M20/M25/M40 family metallo-hydrolase [Candidatus Latescibacterota bacterium]